MMYIIWHYECIGFSMIMANVCVCETEDEAMDRKEQLEAKQGKTFYMTPIPVWRKKKDEGITQ